LWRRPWPKLGCGAKERRRRTWIGYTNEINETQGLNTIIKLSKFEYSVKGPETFKISYLITWNLK
jgi:hypothetical protein